MPANEHWGGNTLDLGLFGPGGIGFGSGDFRGWSGSFRQQITIGREDATPAYLPGLPAGDGTCMLGAVQHRPPTAAGTTWRWTCWRRTCRLSAATERHPAAAPDLAPSHPADAAPAGTGRPPLPHLPQRRPLHPPPADRPRPGPRPGLSVHHRPQHHQPPRPPAQPGRARTSCPSPAEEITTYFGHANVWGMPQVGGVPLHHAGGDAARPSTWHTSRALLVSINHPKPERPALALRLGPGLRLHGGVAGALVGLQLSRACALWDSLLRQGRRIVAVGGSDLHRVGTDTTTAPYPLGTPTTWVYAEALTRDGHPGTAFAPGHVFVERRRPRPAPGAHRRVRRPPGHDGRRAEGRARRAGALSPARRREANGLILRLIAPAGVVERGPSGARDRHLPASAPLPRPWAPASSLCPTCAPSSSSRRRPTWTTSRQALMLEALTNPIYIGGRAPLTTLQRIRNHPRHWTVRQVDEASSQAVAPDSHAAS